MNTDNSLESRIRSWRERADQTLEQWLPQAGVIPGRLHEAMRYSVFNGGKRVRPVLAYAA
ncbi:MAG TPA: geranyl transferase, partial [Chromatiales bacterium]|nr:geranyl transferase [Chromatiales bacterium]